MLSFLFGNDAHSEEASKQSSDRLHVFTMAAAASDIEVQAEAFHGAVRELIICLLFFMLTYAFSHYFLVTKYKKRNDRDDFYAGDEGDFVVYRISVWIVSFSGAVAICAILLLPISIFGNEILLLYPKNVFLSWLNSSLIQSLWNYVFLGTNLCIFILLPFSYFFIESQGFSGLKKGIMTRVYESLCRCLLLIVIIICLVNMICIMCDDHKARHLALLRMWHDQLPFIYSCMSLMGVALLLISTPVGLARMFTFIGAYVVKPRLVSDIDADLMVARLEEMTIHRKLQAASAPDQANNNNNNNDKLTYHQLACVEQHYLSGGQSVSLGKRLLDLSQLRAQLERQRQSSTRWLHNVKYPLVMLGLLVLTTLLITLVVINMLWLVTGFRALPEYRRAEYLDLGHHSLSPLGILGALLQVVLIFYITFASFVGFYRLPVLGRLKPRRGHTSITNIILNCVAALVLTSALPVLTRTIGISSFDLLGNYSRLEWLSNLYLVLAYNVVFAAATAVCLFTRFTAAVRTELYKRLVFRLNEAASGRRRQPTESSKQQQHDKTQ